MNERQVDYIITLARKLEYQKLQREAEELQQARQVVSNSMEEVRRHKEIEESNKQLEDLRHYLLELRYNNEHPDPPVYLENGKVKLTLWKALPRS